MPFKSNLHLHMSQPEASGTTGKGISILWKTDPVRRPRNTRPLPFPRKQQAAEEPVLRNNALSFLKDHGFEGEEAARALRHCGGSREKALERLQAKQNQRQTTEPIFQEAAGEPCRSELAKYCETDEWTDMVQVWHACGGRLADAEACLAH